MYSTILVEKREQVGLVRLNRPEARNALNSLLLKELMDALEAFDADPQIGAMVITGDERAFAAGADIREMADASVVEMLNSQMIESFDRIRRVKKPVIAAVSGFSLGGGCELALSCDMIVASETARFGQPEITIGVIPGAGGTQRLTRAVGKAIAMEMVLNNRTLKAEEALQNGHGQPGGPGGALPGRGDTACRRDRRPRSAGSAAGKRGGQQGLRALPKRGAGGRAPRVLCPVCFAGSERGHAGFLGEAQTRVERGVIC